MTRDSLRKMLRESGIRDQAYDLDGEYVDEAYVLARDGIEWAVFYSERGLRSGLRRFQTETEACEYLRTLLINDPTTHSR